MVERPQIEPATSRQAELALVQGRHRLAEIIEVVAGVDGAVAHERESAAVQRVAAGLGHDVDECPGLAAEFRWIHRLVDLELLNGVDRGADHEVVEILVGDFHAVEQIDVVTAALSLDGGQAPRLLQRGAPRSAWRSDDTVGELGQLKKLPAVERKLGDLVIGDDVAHLRICRLQQRNPRANGD